MKLLFLSCLWILVACNTLPPASLKKDFIIADTALKRAKEASADTYFPKSYGEAQSHFEKAKRLFENNQQQEAKKQFQRSIEISEKIEFYSLYKQKETGIDF